MATRKQTTAAKWNIEKARAAAQRRRTIANLPAAVRRDMGPPGRTCSSSRRQTRRALEDRTRQQLYDEAKKRNISGRSRMGKWDLVAALRKSH